MQRFVVPHKYMLYTYLVSSNNCLKCLQQRKESRAGGICHSGHWQSVSSYERVVMGGKRKQVLSERLV